MSLLTSFEKSGNFLFRYRSYVPVFLFVPAVPVIMFTEFPSWPQWTGTAILLGAAAVSLLGFLIRAWAIATTPKGTSGRNTENQVAESLNTTGIYSLLRHPLYLGNYFMWMGIVIFTWNAWFIVLVSLAFWLYYERIMFAEERFLERRFGDAFTNWADKVPAFLPGFRNWSKSQVPFSVKSVLRREYSGVLATVSCFVFIDLFRNYYWYKEWDYNSLSVYILLITMFITLLLRTLKHSTHLLEEEGRS